MKSLMPQAGSVQRPGSATSSQWEAVARRIPFAFVSHIATSKVHLLMHRNDALNINVEVDTRYRNGKPGRSFRHFYVTEKGTRMFTTLAACLDAHPEVASRAEDLYPGQSPNKKLRHGGENQ